MFRKDTLAYGKAAILGLVFVAVGLTIPRASSNPDDSDAQFVAKASAGGMAEVRLGQLAQEHGNSQDVKEFGQRMVTDHSAAGTKLQMVAGQERVNLSSEMTPNDRATYEKLSKLSGAAFDQAYAADMVQDHQQDIADFEKEAKDGKSAAIRQFAQETLPTLRQHLEMAQKMQRSVSAER